MTDPRGFLSNYPTGAILDEVQNTPELFSYIQRLVDVSRQVQFILTGSSNFLLMEKISQPWYVVYGGEQSLQTSAGAFISWRDLDCIPA